MVQSIIFVIFILASIKLPFPIYDCIEILNSNYKVRQIVLEGYAKM